MLIKPTQVTITDMDGKERVFNVSRLPATEGRKVFTQYVTTAAPKIGNYQSNEELMTTMLSYTEALMPDNGNFIQLRTKELINQHTGDWETLMKLELEMVKYNTDFFHPDKISRACDGYKATALKWITSTLSQFLVSSSQKNKQH